VCSKGAQRDGNKTKRSCNPKKRNRHLELVILLFRKQMQ
jgi:hypothetical protein